MFAGHSVVGTWPLHDTVPLSYPANTGYSHNAISMLAHHLQGGEISPVFCLHKQQDLSRCFKAKSKIQSRTFRALKMNNIGLCIVIRWASKFVDDFTRTHDKQLYCLRQPLRTFTECPKM